MIPIGINDTAENRPKQTTCLTQGLARPEMAPPPFQSSVGPDAIPDRISDTCPYLLLRSLADCRQRPWLPLGAAPSPICPGRGRRRSMAVAIGMMGGAATWFATGSTTATIRAFDLQNVGESRELVLEQTEIERPAESRVARVRAVLGRIRARGFRGGLTARRAITPSSASA